MNSSTKRNLALIGIAVAVGLGLFWWRAPADIRFNDSTGEHRAGSGQSSLVAAPADSSADSPRRSESATSKRMAESAPPDQAAAVDDDSGDGLRSAPDSGVRDHLEAEAQLLGPTVTLPDGTKTRAIDSRTLMPVLKGEGFDRYLDALAKQASQEPLAIDLTELYSISANDAARSAEGVTVNRVVCGMKMCLASVTAPSRDAFAPWFEAFLKNPSAQPHGPGRYDNVLSDGTLEFRLFFSTDQSTNSNYHGSGKSP